MITKVSGRLRASLGFDCLFKVDTILSSFGMMLGCLIQGGRRLETTVGRTSHLIWKSRIQVTRLNGLIIAAAYRRKWDTRVHGLMQCVSRQKTRLSLSVFLTLSSLKDRFSDLVQQILNPHIFLSLKQCPSLNTLAFS